MKGDAPERLVSGSDDFTMFLWEPSKDKRPKTRMTGHQQVLVLQLFTHNNILHFFITIISNLQQIKYNAYIVSKMNQDF